MDGNKPNYPKISSLPDSLSKHGSLWRILSTIWGKYPTCRQHKNYPENGDWVAHLRSRQLCLLKYPSLPVPTELPISPPANIALWKVFLKPLTAPSCSSQSHTCTAQWCLREAWYHPQTPLSWLSHLLPFRTLVWGCTASFPETPLHSWNPSENATFLQIESFPPLGSHASSFILRTQLFPHSMGIDGLRGLLPPLPACGLLWGMALQALIGECCLAGSCWSFTLAKVNWFIEKAHPSLGRWEQHFSKHWMCKKPQPFAHNIIVIIIWHSEWALQYKVIVNSCCLQRKPEAHIHKPFRIFKPYSKASIMEYWCS